MPIKLGNFNDDTDVRISDAGELQTSFAEEPWASADLKHLCGLPIRESVGLNGVAILAYRLPLRTGKSIIIRHVGGSYFDVDELETRLERDLDNNRHCIR